MVIDHICFAVRDTKEAVTYWEDIFGYSQMTRTVDNINEKVKVTFLSKKDSITIKLIEPWDDNQSLLNFVRREGAFHHICFRCTSIDEKINELTGKGLRVLAKPRPGEAFNNHNIAFLLAKYGLNIELIDTDEKAEMIHVP
jgi:methylmalonyl-CoA/ethylmalonyl-CoA epimerase